MRRWWRCMGVVGLALVMLGNGECGPSSPDPTDVEWATAQHLDLSRMSGTITGKRIGYFVQAGHGSVGDPYYCVTVTEDALHGASTTEYRGIKQVLYDAVVMGTVLPIERIYSVNDLAKLDGRIVDRQANPALGTWYVVVDRLVGIDVYRVDPVTYYRHIDLGMQLPFEPQ